MRKIKKTGIMFGFIFFSSVFFFISFITSAQEAKAGVFSFAFTYTSSDTEEVGTLGDTTTFTSVLANTGSDSDNYVITMTENPPTPPQWVVVLCSGGICHPGDTLDTVGVAAGDESLIFLEIGPRLICGDASVTITVKSLGNPGLSESITFLLHVHTDCVPVTNRWGLFILISLLSVAGFYLIWKRSQLARAT